MKKLFSRLPLFTKLILTGLIPLICLIVFTLQIRKDKQKQVQELQELQQKIEQSTGIMELIDDLQMERRYSFNHSINHESASQLFPLRKQTDDKIAYLEKDTGKTLDNFKSYTFLDSLKSTRKLIDNYQLEPAAVRDYYTKVILRLNTLAAASLQNISEESEIYQDMMGQKLLSEMITYLGIIRTEVYSSIYYRKNSSIKEQEPIYEMYNSLYNEFITKASPEAVETYQAARDSSNLNNTFQFIERSLRNDRVDNSYTPAEWWDISADGVDQLKKLQRHLLDKVTQKVEYYVQEKKANLNQNLFILISIIILVTVIIFFTIHHISASLKELRLAAEKLALGSTNFELQVKSRDVIGSLTQSIKQIKKNNYHLAEAAKRIGQGDFSITVQPRSKEDVLGNSILHMQKELQQYSEQNREKIWIKTGDALISSSLQGEKNLEMLSKDILNALVNYLEAEIAFFYINNENQLNFTSGYAIPENVTISKTLAFGETLIGQVAVNKKLLHLKDVPADFPKISSGSGAILPTQLLILPLMHHGSVEGVIEIGSMREFDKAALELLKTVSPNIAVAIQSAKSRIRLQELFEETQSQSEELQAQHSVLENLNTELEAQTQKLQASEEELKVQQEELLQANQELEERSKLLEEKNQVIVERNLDIQKKAEELEISTKYKSEFLANMSHELRTPLNSILLLSRLMGENTEKNLTPDQVEYAQVIQSSGNGLLALIDEILDLSKIEAGKMELEYQEITIRSIVEEMQNLFQPLAREKNLELQFHLSDATPETIMTDQLRLGQILKNLFSNALKFTSHGFISLDISIPENNESYIRFAVKDTGIGIPQEKQNLVFEAFQQADGSTRRKFGGTGLGLSICRELAKLLGGSITLKSKPNQGSEFILIIPRFQPSKQPVIEALPPAEPLVPEPVIQEKEEPAHSYVTLTIPKDVADDRKNFKAGDKAILIIEDDTNFARALLKFTRKKGYKGIVSVRGDEGIELARQYKPLAILLDIQLPVKDGWQVMEELKSNPETRHIPVHVMSSLEARKESLLKGAIDFINKPVALEQMQTIFRKLEDALTRNPKKVLIIEENPQHAKALAYFLQTFNVNAEITGTITDGVNALKKQEVDCVILDMGIPDRHVYETLETIKKNPGLENLPIIVFTGQNLVKAEESRLKQYADSIVMKTAHSYQRILDEVGIFLHLVEETDHDHTNPKQHKLGMLTEVLANKTVLIADDDVRNIFSLSKALEQHKMKVISATDGKEALRLLEENPTVDIVLMDMMMPEMDGYESTSRIRKNPRFKKLPILAVTAKAMMGDREKCIKAGASDYISKPVDIDQLISLLRVWLYDRNK